jgi:hypothetical protein
MHIEYRDGLLFTAITIHFNGNMKVINNIVIDTCIITSYGIGGRDPAFAKTVQAN